MSKPEQAKAADASPTGNGVLRLVKVDGIKANGRPFIGVNIKCDDERAPVVSMALMEKVVKADDAELLEFRERCRKALVWRMTHKAILNKQPTGEHDKVVVVSKEKALQARSQTRVGDEF